MKCAAAAAWSAILFFGATSLCYSAAAPGGPAAKPEPASASKEAARSLDDIFDKILISIDGSIIQITAAEGRLSREITAPNGAMQRSTFMFINDRLGTVSDARDTSKVIAVFRATEQEIFIQYADGASEHLIPNAGGGISIEMRSAKSATYCTSWYPEGHVFSMDERKAALAQYANRLGLNDPADKKIDSGAGCGAAVTPLSAAAAPSAVPTSVPAPAPVAGAAAVAPPLAPPAMDAAPDKSATNAPQVLPGLAGKGVLPATQPVEVRKSEVHVVDPMMTAELHATPAVVSKDAMPAIGGTSASSCLTVESDGMHWGFRNRCGYTVQYAYCTLDGRNQLTACKDGSVGGSVAPNGFGALVMDENLKEVNADHDFRWVACQGAAGEVIPRLEQADPPMGRCVR